jgi:omega-6 fatty acid desaturase (delta-12 desaturase)
MTKAQRLQYRVERHPLTVLGGYATVFAYKQCIQPLFEDPRRYWDSALALLLHVALVTVLLSVGGPELLAFTLLLPLGLATALGTYLFYAQHTCPGIVASEPESWSFVDAALRASSFMEGGALFHWFTGNIGYHHVHHLNPRIPFYRLPEAMRALPDLQIPPRTSIRPSAVWACLRLGLWDETSGRMMSFGASRARD